MTRRSDDSTAEKLSIALLTRAAFGLEAGVRVAMLYGVKPTLVEAVFHRAGGNNRTDIPGPSAPKDRRRTDR